MNRATRHSSPRTLALEGHRYYKVPPYSPHMDRDYVSRAIFLDGIRPIIRQRLGLLRNVHAQRRDERACLVESRHCAMDGGRVSVRQTYEGVQTSPFRPPTPATRPRKRTHFSVERSQQLKGKGLRAGTLLTMRAKIGPRRLGARTTASRGCCSRQERCRRWRRAQKSPPERARSQYALSLMPQ